MEAALAADPLAVAALVVVAVEVEAVAGGTEGVSGAIVAALQASERIFINNVMTELDSAQRLQVIVDEEENIVKALTGIAEYLTYSQIGKTAEQIVEARDGLQMVVAVGGDEGA